MGHNTNTLVQTNEKSQIDNSKLSSLNGTFLKPKLKLRLQHQNDSESVDRLEKTSDLNGPFLSKSPALQ